MNLDKFNKAEELNEFTKAEELVDFIEAREPDKHTRTNPLAGADKGRVPEWQR